MRFPHHRVEQTDFSAVVYNLFHSFFMDAPIVSAIKMLIGRPADIRTVYTVDFVQRVLIYGIAVASVFFLQTFDFNVLKAVSFCL